MLRFVVILLIPCALASSCVRRNACQYLDTRPLGVPFMTNSTHHIHPRSCGAVCALTYGCIAVALDPAGKLCHFFNESNYLGITQDPGATLVLFQAEGVQCIRVS